MVCRGRSVSRQSAGKKGERDGERRRQRGERDTSSAKREERHANGHGSPVWRAMEQRDRLLERRGQVEKRTGGEARKRREVEKEERVRNSGRNASPRRARGTEREIDRATENGKKRAGDGRAGKRERGKGRNKSGKNESIGGVFHDAPLEAPQVGERNRRSQADLGPPFCDNGREGVCLSDWLIYGLLSSWTSFYRLFGCTHRRVLQPPGNPATSPPHTPGFSHPRY